MTDAAGLAPESLKSLFQVLSHPDHQQGLEAGRRLVVDRVESRASALVRVIGRITGEAALDAWVIPNATVRLELPETPEEFAGIEGAPPTTSRVYTVAALDPASREVAIDFVVHPEASPAMRWVSSVRPGESVPLIGPRPHRIPGDGSPRILLADSSALPAALSIIRHQPCEGRTIVIAAVNEDELGLFREEATAAVTAATGDESLLRILGAGTEAETPLSEFFADFEIPDTASVWASGEREDMRALRSYCRRDLGLPAERVQVFGYWKRGVSNTRIDVARLQATSRALAEGRPFGDTDDFEIGI